ncbi:hypothetical protein MOKP38_46300 [Mycobacterium avium subsp. hominissuis]
MSRANEAVPIALRADLHRLQVQHIAHGGAGDDPPLTDTDGLHRKRVGGDLTVDGGEGDACDGGEVSEADGGVR